MATLPVFNATIPHLSLIPGGMRHGTMLRLKGQMNHGGNRFSVNIQTGAAVRPRDDTQLHLSVRPSDGVIVRNHFEKQVWGTEERYGSCPIYPGSGFEIIILAEFNCYKVAINGQHFCAFNHRLPMNTARYLSINGDCTMQSMTVEQDQFGAPGGGGGGHVPIGVPYPIHPTPPPHHQPITGGYPGSVYPKPPYPTHHVPTPPPMPPFRPYPGNHHHNHHHHVHHHPARPHSPWIQPRGPTECPSPVPPPSAAYSYSEAPTKRKDKNKALKYAAGIGAGAAGIGVGAAGIGLGAFALSRALAGSSSDSD